MTSSLLLPLSFPLVVLTAACGTGGPAAQVNHATTGTGGASSSVSSGGSSSSSASSSGAAVAADGAWSVALESNSGACHTLSDTDTVGAITASAVSMTVTNGVDGASVSCTISSAGGWSMAIHGIATLGPRTLEITIPKIDGAASQATPAPGSISFSSPQTNGAAYASAACNFYFAGAPEVVDVGVGKIWISFDCPAVSGQGSTCAIGPSVVMFEHCS